MHADIVFPKGNENQFIEIAQKLEYDALCFVYKYKNDEDFLKTKNKIINENKNLKIKLFLGLLLEFKNISKIKKLADIIVAESSHDNRNVLEKRYADIIYNLEEYSKKDFMHHRASGLNHVLCDIANKKDVSVGFSFGLLLNSEKNLSQIAGRISQNIKLCRKYKVKTVIASFASNPYSMRSSHDLISLFSSLGMHPKEAKDSLSNVFRIIDAE